MKKLIFTGGGTAGHVMPNIALIKRLECEYEIHYVGSSGMEKNLLANLNIFYHEIECIKLVRSFSLKNLSIPFVLSSSVFKCKTLLEKIKPSLVFSKGGYVGLPLALACKKYPLILHESDYSLGLANKLALKNAKILCTSFDCIKHKKAIYTGSAIREEIYNGNRNKALVDLGLKDNGKPFLLVIGGSLGAKVLNDFVFANFDSLVKNFNVVHVVGKNETRARFGENYRALPFAHNVCDLFALSDYILSRGGANTLSEIVALKKACVCVPLEKGSRGDQILNANYYESKNAICVLKENNLSLSAFYRKINYLHENASTMRKNMNDLRVDGTEKLVEIIRLNSI